MAKSRTSAQIVVDISTGELHHFEPGSFQKWRKMRRDPTIALGRAFATAPILAATWSVEGDDDEAEALVRQEFLAIRTFLLRTALYGMIDFGWKAYELVYGLKDVVVPATEEQPEPRTLKLTGLDKLKPLKNDTTFARYDKRTGDFIGFKATDLYTGEEIQIDEDHSLFVNFDDEGLGQYAEPLMKRAEVAYDQWNDANDGAARYDHKTAGTFLVIEYPVGKTPYAKNGGEETDNGTIAEDIVKALQSSGAVAIPKDLQKVDSSLPEEANAWKIYFLDHQAQQANFVDRMKYLDALKIRAFAVPERSILEGEFGTKAESGVQGNFALLIMHQRHEDITELVNQTKVKRLLEANGYRQDAAWLKAMPLSDERMVLFGRIFDALLADPGIAPEILDAMDHEQLLDALGVPLKGPEARDAESTERETEPLAAESGGTNRLAAPSTNGFAGRGPTVSVSVA